MTTRGMNRKSLALAALLFLSLACTAGAAQDNKKDAKEEPPPQGTPVLWREPADIETRNLLLGPGGEGMKPDLSSVTFVKEETGGYSPKFRVTDGSGKTWVAKMGKEAQPETASVRLAWAVGYATEISYLVPCVQIKGAPHPKKGKVERCEGGGFVNVRFEARPESVKRLDEWSWTENPFVGTKELQGLLVMMALVNNWDLKKSNNGIYNVRGRELRYMVSDLGATFGKTGGDWSRSKNDVEDYVNSKFIEEVEPNKVDLVLNSRPPLLYAVAVPYFYKRARMENVAEDIPRIHARWMGVWLAQLSAKQISDAFRAAGYAPSEVTAYTRKVLERIRQLNSL